MPRRLLLAAAFIGPLACQDLRTPPVASQTVVDSADQLMFGVRTILNDRGVQRADMTADTMRMYDDNTRAEMQRVKVLFHTQQGQLNATLTARAGTYNTRLQSMEARGDVIVTSEDGRKLETPQLRYDPARNEISSDSAFVVTAPGCRSAGTGFVADPQLNNVRVLRGARARGDCLTVQRP